jgi:nucleotide-binding universal stress UspA family protein
LFSKSLVAVDGSESAKKAFDKSLQLALKCNATIDLAHVIKCELGGDSSEVFNLIEEIKREAEKMLEPYRTEASKLGVPLNLMVVQGDPAQIIIHLAKENNYDLIIMGSRGRGPLQELLLGSVSHKVVHHASTPVLIMK